MSLVIGEHVTHAFADEPLLARVSFHLSEMDRIGLVGPNGCGKTTLLRIIAGQVDSHGGQVHRRKDLRVGYLPQEPPAPRDITVHGAALEAFADVRRMEDELHVLAERMGGPHDEDLNHRYGALEHEFSSRGGYEYPRRIEEVLGGLAFPREMWDRPLADLSGGQRTRVYLAAILLAEPDLIILDEPTNHLDLERVQWLEDYLAGFRGALVLVSHDRYFLDRVTRGTWELSFGRLESYPAPYSQYLVLREERFKQRMREWEAQQEYIRHTEDFIAKNIYGLRGGEAQGRRTRLERFMRDEAIERPREHPTMNLALDAGRRTGDLVLVAGDMAIGYDAARPLLTVERLDVHRTDRIAILGPNGAGKTTLLRTLIGELVPLGGSLKTGSNVHVGYLSQTRIEASSGKSALDALCDSVPGCLPQQARNALGAVLISGDDALKPVAALSGGQQTRLILARLMVQGSNVLALDEPTNHLDIPSTEILQEALAAFEGAVLLVSHDRYLVQALATQVWALQDGRLHVLQGGWDRYCEWVAAQGTPGASSAGKEVAKEAWKDRKARQRIERRETGRLNRLRRRHEALEAEIGVIEKELASRTEEITGAGNSGDVARVEELGRQFAQRQARLDALWKEWEEVAESLK